MVVMVVVVRVVLVPCGESGEEASLRVWGEGGEWWEGKGRGGDKRRCERGSAAAAVLWCLALLLLLCCIPP